MKTQEKRPDDIRLIVISYQNRLASSDSIDSSAWTISQDLEGIGEGIIGTHYTFLLVQDGEQRMHYTLENIIVANSGESKRTSVPLFIKPDDANILIEA